MTIKGLSRRVFLERSLQGAALASVSGVGASLISSDAFAKDAKDAKTAITSTSLGPNLRVISGAGGNVVCLGSKENAKEGVLLVDGGEQLLADVRACVQPGGQGLVVGGEGAFDGGGVFPGERLGEGGAGGLVLLAVEQGAGAVELGDGLIAGRDVVPGGEKAGEQHPHQAGERQSGHGAAPRAEEG